MEGEPWKWRSLCRFCSPAASEAFPAGSLVFSKSTFLWVSYLDEAIAGVVGFFCCRRSGDFEFHPSLTPAPFLSLAGHHSRATPLSPLYHLRRSLVGHPEATSTSLPQPPVSLFFASGDRSRSQELASEVQVPGVVIGGLPEVWWTLGLREPPAAPLPVVGLLVLTGSS
ncbi:hypothetical protein Cgig2_010366 [Carnegiea gigantea]|uniref:Uncharacterized protein n=1 Tax=Carnegiea gigantea TaxID=171969 RepID=A0A9Q1K4B3_9CARY|nr:hypothetical protein Cgig2_010366 [Carnegiea gigantea]